VAHNPPGSKTTLQVVLGHTGDHRVYLPAHSRVGNLEGIGQPATQDGPEHGQRRLTYWPAPATGITQHTTLPYVDGHQR